VPQDDHPGNSADGPTQDTSPTAIGDAKDLAAAVRDATIVLGAYLYYTGFVHLHKFYASLGVDTSATDLSPQEILAYSFSSVWEWKLELFAFVVGLLAIYFGLQYLRRKEQDPEKSRFALFGALELGIFVIASVLLAHILFTFANTLGHDTAVTARTSSEPIFFNFRDDKKKFGTRLNCFNDSHQLFFAAETRDFYIVAGGDQRAHPQIAYGQPIFRVAKRDVSAAEVELAFAHTRKEKSATAPTSSGTTKLKSSAVQC
jgi:hypothetical protein